MPKDPSDQPRQNDNLTVERRLLDSGRPERAVSALESRLAVASTSLETGQINTLLGDAASAQGDYGTAVWVYRNAISAFVQAKIGDIANADTWLPAAVGLTFARLQHTPDEWPAEVLVLAFTGYLADSWANPSNVSENTLAALNVTLGILEGHKSQPNLSVRMHHLDIAASYNTQSWRQMLFARQARLAAYLSTGDIAKAGYAASELGECEVLLMRHDASEVLLRDRAIVAMLSINLARIIQNPGIEAEATVQLATLTSGMSAKTVGALIDEVKLLIGKGPS